jgi:ATP-dependent DNA helicase RecG
MLVSTTVIEVGVDIPNATVMVVENAERFGLSQLHQLRGRVRRGAHRAFCLLLAGTRSEDAWERLNVLARTEDGFEVAEEDLRMRGPGEFYGTRQHGLPDLKMADVIGDTATLIQAREIAFELVEADPELSHPDHRALKREIHQRVAGRMKLVDVS